MDNAQIIGELIWHTDLPDDSREVIITAKDGHSRWILPECYYSHKSRTWFHKVIDDFDMPVEDPEIEFERIPERWEKLYIDVIAWTDYPDPYMGS